MKKIIKAIENDLFGHESWVLIGNEQHKEYWWACIGDCSNWNVDPFLKIKDIHELEYAIVLKDKTFIGLMKQINLEVKKRLKRLRS